MFTKKDFIKTNPITKLLRITAHVVRGEVNQIKNLEVTKEDREQGEKLGKVFVMVCASMGYPCPAVAEKVLAKVLAYGLRDAKDGVDAPETLIISRIIEELKKEHNK